MDRLTTGSVGQRTMESGSAQAPAMAGAPSARSRRTLTRRARKYATAFRIGLLGQFAYAGELWVRTLFLLTVMFVFSSLWHTTYAQMGRPTLGGFTLAQMLWYLAITESIVLSRGRDSIRIDEEVRTGDFAYALVRPYHFVLYRYSQMLGERLVRAGFNLAVALPLAYLFARAPGLEATALLPALVVVVLAMTVDFLFVLSIQLLAFWVEDTTPMVFIYDRVLLILGGVLLPVALLPDVLGDIARALPFSAIINGPARTAVAFDAGEFGTLLMRLGVWLAVAAVVSGWMFRLGVRRASVNGG